MVCYFNNLRSEVICPDGPGIATAIEMPEGSLLKVGLMPTWTGAIPTPTKQVRRKK